jgi:hypothetical protein
MLSSLSQRLLPVLQLTRMALVFTAIADSTCSLLLLWAKWGGRADASWDVLDVKHVVAVILISVGLYGYGMSLNDINDRRRDRAVSPNRPLPSGRIGVLTAHVVCAAFAMAALIGGFVYGSWQPAGMMCVLLVVWTGVLITFYDFAGKYLVAPGLLSLGLIRFFHAVIPAPQLPLLWHPLLLLNHVTILSTIAYDWEEKRPPLTRVHWWAVLGGLALVDVVSIALVAYRRAHTPNPLGIERGLLVPLVAVLVFVLLALLIYQTVPVRRQAGQRLMLYGLLWLIVYDAAFAFGYVNWVAGVVLIALLPMAYFSVQLMRWWGNVLSLSQRPQFKRAEVMDRRV